jgi:RNA recognition motif-containing protein
MKIFAGSLPFSLEDNDLRSYFEKFGEVSSAKVISDKFSGRSKGFGFVEMPDDEQAKQAIAALNNSEINGRAIVVNEAMEKKEGDRKNFGPDKRKGGGFGGNNRGGGGGGYGGGGGGGKRW